MAQPPLKLVTYRPVRADAGYRLGAMTDAGLVDLSECGELLDVSPIQNWSRMRACALESRTILPIDEVEWSMPIQRPGKIICLGLNYADHAAEGGHSKPDYPSIFLRSATSLVPHRHPIPITKVSAKLDYEAELACVIGKRARSLTPENALSVVAGYSCFNDATLRDYQKRTSQWTIGKNFDRTGAFGPWMIPASDLPPGASGLAIETRLNGETMQKSNTSHMLFSVVETLCLLSAVMTLEPGDVIAMGTPAGVGYARTPPVWMKDGDVVEIAIEGIGVLENRIQQESQS